MSIPVVKLQDPQLDIIDRVYYAKMGGSDVTQQEIQATSFSNSQVIMNTTTPSVNVGLDRRILANYTYRVSFAVTDQGGVANVVNTVTAGLRAFSNASTMETLSLKLNNSTMTINLDDVIHPLMKYGSSPDERNRYMSGGASYPDQFPTYDLAPSGFDAGARNPFSIYTTNPVETTRNFRSWVSNIIFNPAPPGTNVASFDLNIIEPLFIPPLNWSELEVQALFGIQTIDISINHSNLKRILSAVNDSVAPVGNQYFANARVDILNYPKFLLTYYSPQLNMPVPKLLHYPYYEIGRYVTNANLLLANNNPLVPAVPAPAGASQTQFSVNNVSFHSIPKRIFIFCAQRKSDKTLNSPDVYARIDRISLNWNNRAGILSSSSQYQLYKIAVKNGSDQSWDQWTKYQGSVLCLEMGTDIPLSAVQASGARGNWQLSYTIDFTNLQPVDVTYQVYTIAVQEGYMSINDSIVSLDVGVLTEQSILDAPFAEPGTYNEIKNMMGSGIWGSIWKGIKKISPVIRNVITKVAPIVGKVASFIPHPAAQAVAQGANVVEGVGKALGGKRMPKRTLSARVRR